jgi:hypothetical protein
MTYQDRAEAETQTGHPCLPCPHCGHDAWAVERPWRKSKRDRPRLFPAQCGHCGVVETAHHVDGEWLGAYHYSKHPGSLRDFVQEHAAWLRATT